LASNIFIKQLNVNGQLKVTSVSVFQIDLFVYTLQKILFFGPPSFFFASYKIKHVYKDYLFKDSLKMFIQASALL